MKVGENNRGAYSGYLNNEIKSLQEKITALGDKMSRKETPQRLKVYPVSTELPRKTAQKSGKLLKSQENTTKKPLASNSFTTDSSQVSNLKSKAISLRQENSGLQQTNERLKFKIQFKDPSSEKAKTLKEEISDLKKSIKRSENIRKKQKALINSLKKELSSFQVPSKTLHKLPRKDSVKNSKNP